jgi:hypothetical protein
MINIKKSSDSIDSIDSSENERIEKQYEFIFYHGSFILQKYLLKKFNIDISKVCTNIPISEPIIQKNHDQLVMRIVDIDHKNTLDKEFNIDIKFFINSVNSVFSILKEGIVENDIKILDNYNFILDDEYNMYIDDGEEIEFKIAVVKKE